MNKDVNISKCDIPNLFHDIDMSATDYLKMIVEDWKIKDFLFCIGPWKALGVDGYPTFFT